MTDIQNYRDRLGLSQEYAGNRSIVVSALNLRAATWSEPKGCVERRLFLEIVPATAELIEISGIDQEDTINCHKIPHFVSLPTILSATRCLPAIHRIALC